jgi:phage shock protein E
VEIVLAIIIVVFVVALAFAVQFTRNQTAGVSVAQIRDFLRAGGVLLDVRTAGEYEKEHLDGAINIPHDQVEDREYDLPVNKLAPIVVYSGSGAQASVVEQALRGMGYATVINGGAYDALKTRL